jgi:hypothetical protein
VGSWRLEVGSWKLEVRNGMLNVWKIYNYLEYNLSLINVVW